MKTARIGSAIVLAAALCVAFFSPKTARADLPYLTQVGTLTTAGDVVSITGLTGQSSCAFYLTGSPSAIDVYGSPDISTLTTNLSPLAAADYASPPNTQLEPFTPSVGQAYQIAPTSLRQLQITADTTWSGGPATVFIGCSESAAARGIVQVSGPVTVIPGVTPWPVTTPAPAATDTASPAGVLVGCDGTNCGFQPTPSPVPVPTTSPGYTGASPSTYQFPVNAQLSCWYLNGAAAPALAVGNSSYIRCDTNSFISVDPWASANVSLTAASGSCTQAAAGALWVTTLTFATTVQTGTVTLYDDASAASCTGNKIYAVATAAAGTIVNLQGYPVLAGRFLDYEWTTAGEAGGVYVLYKK